MALRGSAVEVFREKTIIGHVVRRRPIYLSAIFQDRQRDDIMQTGRIAYLPKIKYNQGAET